MNNLRDSSKLTEMCANMLIPSYSAHDSADRFRIENLQKGTQRSDENFPFLP